MKGMASTRLLPALGLAALASCGRLEVPDLSAGEVSGRVLAASPGAYVYVLGSRKLVVIDGATKAQFAGPVEVRPASRSRLDDVDAAVMPLAGQIVVTLIVPAGAGTAGALYTAELSDQRSVRGEQVGSGAGAVLGPLPAGRWSLTAVLGGHRQRSQLAVDVAAGLATQTEIDMDVEEQDQRRGCLATGCSSGLHCDPGDGHCRACLDDTHCDASDHCDTSSHTCEEALPGTGGLCESAPSASYCVSGQWVPPGAGPGYCSQACGGAADPPCPAGWACSAGVCQVKLSCLDWSAAFGSACSRDSACQVSLYGGNCLRAGEDRPGYCSAPCDPAAANCPAGFACRSFSAANYCVPLP
jgi:hypothetical protein